MPTQITPALLEPYFQRTKRHIAYDEVNKIYDGLRIHANGEFPTDVIRQQRPSEPPDVQRYREIIFQAVTKETVSRVFTCLSKIRRSADWSIRFDPKTFDASIAEEENPENYFIENYPSFTSITNWLFSVALRNYLIDANGIVAVVPLNPTPLANEYLRPFPLIFNSDQVYEYLEGDYCVIESKDKARYLQSDGKTWNNEGKIFWVITYEVVQKWVQVNSKGDMRPEIDFVHGLGYMPAFKLGGVFMRSIDNTFIYESRIQPIVPRLNKASREDNDLDVSVVRHLFPEKWEYISVDCPKCNGIGKIVSSSNASGFAPCESCKGIGKVISSPFQTHLVKAGGLGDTDKIPVPPAGYIVKDVDIIKVQDERIEKHISKALAAINMEFLSHTPLNESGTAKEVDKDELNNFVHAIAEDLVKILDKIIFVSYDYRYLVRVPNKDRRKGMLPQINVPEKYDMLSVNYLLQEYGSAKTAKLNPLIIAKLEEELCVKKFSTDPDLKDELLTILKLDPFAGMSTDDKLSASSNGWIAKLDCIISANIQAFVRKAKFENDDFYSWDIDKQQEKMIEYAEEKEIEMSAAGKIKALMEIDIQKEAQTQLNPPQDQQDTTNQDATTSPTGSDIVGKLPLALQQLALAADRAKAQGNMKLAQKIQAKMSELVPLISEDAITGTAN